MTSPKIDIRDLFALRVNYPVTSHLPAQQRTIELLDTASGLQIRQRFLPREAP
jgi:hypothetical protein